MAKISKKVMSLTLASAVAVTSAFGGNYFVSSSNTSTVLAAETKLAASIPVHFKKPSGWNTCNIYAFYSTDEVNSKATAITEEWNSKTGKFGTPMTASKDSWYDYTLDCSKVPNGSKVYVMFLDPSDTTNNRYPAEGHGHDLCITQEAWLDGSNLSKNPTLQTSTPGAVTASPSATPKITPTATAPVTDTRYLYFDNTTTKWANVYIRDCATPASGTAHVCYKGEKINNTNIYRFTINKMTEKINFKDTAGDTFNNQTASITLSKTINRYTPTTSEKKNDGYKKYQVKGDVYTDTALSTPTTSTSPTPTATASATPTVKPTATPIADTITSTVAPVNGPYVDTNYGQTATWADSKTNDSRYIKLQLKGGATSAVYSLDGGPATTITQDTAIEVGEGKIANTDIVLKVTSTDGIRQNTQTFTFKKLPNYDNYDKKPITTLSRTMNSLFQTLATTASTEAKTMNIHFTAPNAWTADSANGVYAYSYYVDANKTLHEPLGCWPGKKLTKGSDGYFSTSFVSTIGKAELIMVCAKNVATTVTTPAPNTDGNNYYSCEEVGRVPEQTTTSSTLTLTATENYISKTGVITTPATATPTPTATPSNKLRAYFGAEKSAPQLLTTKQTISAIATNAQGTLSYAFYVDGKQISTNSNLNSVTWDPSSLKAGSHTLKAIISDTKSAVTLEKTYTLLNANGSTAVPSPTPTATATASATPTSTVTATTPTVTAATATPIVTTTPTTVPTATPVDLTMATDVPDAPGATTTPIVTMEPTTTPVVAGGNITFNSTNKTAGEVVKISFGLTNAKNGSAYTYSYYAGSKKIASMTQKTSVNWTTTKAGTYTIKVVVYENGSKVNTITSTYKVKARVITIKSFKTNKKSGVKKNTKITLSASASVKSGKAYYKFAVKKGSGSIKTIRNYAKKKTATWKPTKKGTYTLYLYVKNGKGVVISKTKTFKVK